MLQARQRGRAARQQVGRIRRERTEQSSAAVRIQSAHRGKAARKRTSEMHERRRQAQSQRRAVPAARARPPPDASVHQKLAHKLEGRLERLETEEWVQEQEQMMASEDAWRAEQEQAATMIQVGNTPATS